LRLRQRAPGQERFVVSSLSLVDLGGSERVSKSKANELIKAPGGYVSGEQTAEKVSWKEYYSCRERITETNHINKGLLTLKRCVQALNQRQAQLRSGKPGQPVRVPFYDSRLTQLLEPALNSYSHTRFIVCCSRADVHAEETVQTLRFGQMCSSVEHERKDTGLDAGAAVSQAILQLDAEIKAVEAEILQKETWQWRVKTDTHVVDEMNTGGAIVNKDEEMELGGAGAVEISADDGQSKKHSVEHDVWGQVLVGAEAENRRRDELLNRRDTMLKEMGVNP